MLKETEKDYLTNVLRANNKHLSLDSYFNGYQSNIFWYVPSLFLISAGKNWINDTLKGMFDVQMYFFYI